MYYIYIDESGDSGDPKKNGSSLDFSMCAFICNKDDISQINSKVIDLIEFINKKELKYSKISKKDKVYSLKYLNKLNLNIKSVYFNKNKFYRKMYEKIIKRYFKNFKLKFANSIKTPLLQVADFYAGYKREIKSKNI